uniref:Cyclin-dependent kinase 4 inhibitor B-like n=1 Tax=Labrus bergylta TaxID=56723 RepID=A0A3Q3GAI4_9LABR
MWRIFCGKELKLTGSIISDDPHYRYKKTKLNVNSTRLKGCCSTRSVGISLSPCMICQVMMMGSTPVARLLLTHGANPNVADRSTEHTPLHDAARMGFLDTVKLLVEFKANPQARDKDNLRPRDLAGKYGHTNVVDFLDSLE